MGKQKFIQPIPFSSVVSQAGCHAKPLFPSTSIGSMKGFIIFQFNFNRLILFYSIGTFDKFEEFEEFEPYFGLFPPPCQYLFSFLFR